MGGGREGRDDEKEEEGMDVKARAVVGRGRDKESGKERKARLSRWSREEEIRKQRGKEKGEEIAEKESGDMAATWRKKSHMCKLLRWQVADKVLGCLIHISGIHIIGL